MAQITTQCTFPTSQPTRCDLFQDNPPGAEEAILTPVNSSSLTGNWVGRDLYINATFTVNSTFTIYISRLRFGPKGRIVVGGHGGGNLHSVGSSYFGCYGWDGRRRLLPKLKSSP